MNDFIWTWKHFSPTEVLSPDGLTQYCQGNLLIQPAAMDKLEELRESVQSRIFINHGELTRRGYRSPAENQQCGGALFSRHMQGLAFDVTIEGMTPDEVSDRAGLLGWTFTIPYPGYNFCHIDLGVRL